MSPAATTVADDNNLTLGAVGAGAFTVTVDELLAFWPALSVTVSCTVKLPTSLASTLAVAPSVALLNLAMALPLVMDH